MGRNAHSGLGEACIPLTYTSFPMFDAGGGSHADGVTLLHPHHARRLEDLRGARRHGREPQHPLAEQACDLLLAARGLRSMAGVDGTLPAVAATLGCLEATIDALADTLEQVHGDEAEGPLRDDDPRAIAARILRNARDVTGSLRELLGPALAEVASVTARPTLSAGRRRDPAHVLYDHACELAAAAAAMRAESRERVSPGDVETTLRCVSAGLDALAAGLEALDAQATRQLDEAGRPLAGEAPAGGVAERLREAGATIRDAVDGPGAPPRHADGGLLRLRPRRAG